ncbi:MAG: ABC transporter permease [Myxococcaceae bacterium]
MPILEIFRTAIDAIIANKLRSLLTTLGIIIGIAAVIAMMALGEGAKKSIESQLNALGSNVLTIRPGQNMFGGIGRGQAQLTIDDAEALRAKPVHIRNVAPEMESRLQVELGAKNANLSIVGTWQSYFELNNHALALGRLYTDAEDRGRRRVAVLGALAGNQLGVTDTSSMVGETILVRGVPFEVVGVLKEKGGQGFWNPDENIYIPLGTAELRVMGGKNVRSIAIQAVSETAMGDAMAEVDRVLRREHRLRPGVESDFNIRDQAALLSTVQETAQTFSFLLAGVAAISLLVGGIGIMNIMLVSVTERTREIGLRKALGARRGDILRQFLIESLVLCVAGGALGIGLGMGGTWVLQRAAGWQMEISPMSVALAFGFAAGVGVFFGLWPARRAAMLSPIEALRYE